MTAIPKHGATSFGIDAFRERNPRVALMRRINFGGPWQSYRLAALPLWDFTLALSVEHWRSVSLVVG